MVYFDNNIVDVFIRFKMVVRVISKNEWFDKYGITTFLHLVVKATDIEKSSYKSAIETLVQNKIVRNVDKFEPEKPITRAEFVKLLANAYGFEKKTSKKRFRDVNYRSDLALYINFGVEMGWINIKNVDFRPNDPITRGEAQKLLDVIEEKAIADTVAEPSATITRGQAAKLIVEWMTSVKKD